MAISLYDASVASYLQTLQAMSGFLDKGLEHFRAQRIDPETVVEARLAADMLPLRFQVLSTTHHSLGALDGVRSGTFRPPGERPSPDYKGLQKLVSGTLEQLRKLTPEEVNAFEGAEVAFEVRDTKRIFTAENFILSFSLPNFHFHATTAYDILRANGVPIGKRDYMGALRLKASA